MAIFLPVSAVPLLITIMLPAPPQNPGRSGFSIEEAAALTGLSEDHVRRHVTAGLLPVSNQGTFEKPYYRIHRKDIDEWMAKRREAACPAPRKKKAPAKYVSRHHNKDA
jgi:excisionase family DNA binding protein